MSGVLTVSDQSVSINSQFLTVDKLVLFYERNKGEEEYEDEEEVERMERQHI